MSEEIIKRLDRIEQALAALLEQKRVKDFYTPAEAPQVLSRAEFTVREWHRLGRVDAEKRLPA